MKLKIVLIKWGVILSFFLGCTDGTPPKKSKKIKHKPKTDMWYEKKDFIKDTIYILWEKQKIQCEGGMFLTEEERKKCFYYNTPYYSEQDEGIVFQVSKYDYLIFENGSVSDILKIKNLDAYQIHTANEMDSLDEKWRDKNELILKKTVANMLYYYFGHSSTRNRNSMYVTYLIKINDNKKHFTIYPVRWYYPVQVVE